MSAACPCAPPRGCDLRLPGAPAPSKKAPIEAAMPKHTVATSHGMNCSAAEVQYTYSVTVAQGMRQYCITVAVV
eukprot:21171-Heterococcus_DN1.PRE.2